MRLIDRDLLLSEIEKSREKNTHNDSKIRANHTIEHDHIAHLVLEQPTAYDVDKVVEQISDLVKPTEQYRHSFCSTVTDEHCANYKDCEFCITEQIYKVVKSGGIE